MHIHRGIKPRPRRVALYGVHGVGKSTWAAASPVPVFADIEGGIDNIDCASVRIRSYTEFMTFLGKLRDEDHEFQTVVNDSADWLEKLIHEQVSQDAQKPFAEIGYGNGFKMAMAYWDEVFDTLDVLRDKRHMHIVFLAHAAIKKFSSPEMESYDRFQPALHESASAYLQEWCDEVLFVNYEHFTTEEDLGFNRTRKMGVDGGGTRKLRCRESAAVVAKNRLGMPETIDFTWDAYQAWFPQVKTKVAPEPQEVSEAVAVAEAVAVEE